MKIPFIKKEKYSKYIKKFNNVTWNVPILCENYDNLNKLNTKIKYVAYGSPKCYFNCGRTGEDINTNQVLLNISLLNNKNIPCYVTFSNYKIQEKHLDDTMMNQILDGLNNNPTNGVICSSEILRHYIKNTYPNLKLKASIILSTMLNKENDINWYTEQLNLYDYVVAHVDASINTLKQLPCKDKFEILVNEECVKNCPNRKNHCYNLNEYYEVIAYHGCICSKAKPDQKCKMNFNQIQSLINMGFVNFKLQGRPHNSRLIWELLEI